VSFQLPDKDGNNRSTLETNDVVWTTVPGVNPKQIIIRAIFNPMKESLENCKFTELIVL